MQVKAATKKAGGKLKQPSQEGRWQVIAAKLSRKVAS
jgi:hypothetical protein